MECDLGIDPAPYRRKEVMADLQERYLHAVRWALPAAKAEDIVAELRDVLATRQEDREQELGRPLTTDETSALLKDFGHPLVVAASYRRRQWLIGPDVFPFYFFVARIVALLAVGIQVAVAAARIIFGDGRTGQILAQTWGGLWASLFISLGIVTLVFAVLERVGFPADHVRKWSPDQLPQVTHERKSMWESAFEVAAGAIFLLWWIGAVHFPIPWGGPGFRMEAAPIFTVLYWPILALLAARLVQNLIEWLRPGWRWIRDGLAVLTTVAGLALLAIIYRAGQWVTVISTGMPADKAPDLGNALNLSLKIALVVAAVIWLWQSALWVWKLARRRQSA
jgi:hypothetical protein